MMREGQKSETMMREGQRSGTMMREGPNKEGGDAQERIEEGDVLS